MRKSTILSVALSSCFLLSSAQASPILPHDSDTPASRIQKSNAWIEVDEAAFTRNLDRLKKVTKKAKICTVVKADLYGHSVDLLMPAIMESGSTCIGFANNEEARIARKHGFKGSLMRVRTAPPLEAKDAMQYDVEELVGNLELAKQLSTIAQAANKPIPIHFSINANGLSRNGMELSTAQGKKEALEIANLKGLKIVGLMTHYPVEEVDDVKKDIILFEQQTKWFIKEAKLDRKKLLLHTSNTFAALEVPESHYDAVRVVAALVAFGAPGYETLMTFKTSVAGINTYPKGNTVGYDRTVTLKRDTRLANLPLGYSDGYQAAFGNKGTVLIKGHRVPVIGKISMNTTTVDITDFPDIKVGDEVVLFGKQGKEEIKPEEIEKVTGTIMLDVYSVWGNASPKILVKK